MQKTQLSISQLLLPRVRKGTPATQVKTGIPCSFYSNLFEIKLKGQNVSLFQFSLDISPEIANDSTNLRERIVRSLRSELKKEIGYICDKGMMVWGRRQCKKTLTLVTQFSRGSENFRFQVLVKPVKEINLMTFAHENPQKLASVCQLLNINIKNKLRQGQEEGKGNQMVELSKGTFYEKRAVDDNAEKDIKLSVWRGYNVTVVPNNGRLFFLVDPCSRVLSLDNFLQVILFQRKKGSQVEELRCKYVGQTVLNKKGNMKIYRIDDLVFDINPTHTFQSFQGKTQSYVDYFLGKYGYKVQDLKQPLIKVRVNKTLAISNKETGPQQAKKQREDVFIYLIPEMVVLTGLTSFQKNNRKLMKTLDQHTKMTPQQRMQDSRILIQKISNSQDLFFQVSDRPEQLKGQKLQDPQIKAGENMNLRLNKGTINLRQKVLETHKFTRYIFCYSIAYKQQKYDQGDADYAFKSLQDASKAFGLQFRQPYWLQIKAGDVQSWKFQIEAYAKNQKDKIQIILFFLKPDEQKYYDKLKVIAAQTFSCPSQVVRRKILSSDNRKGIMSCASKIVLQMNSKVGHPLWQVRNHHKYWNQKGNQVAVGSIAISKGKHGNVISFVGTTDPKLTHFQSDAAIVKSRDDFSASFFEKIFTAWIKKYFQDNNKKLPNVLVIYREGMNTVQAKSQIESQVAGLFESINTIRKKAKTPQYNPKISYVLVNKKPNQRIYQGQQGKGKNLSYYNPQAGSIIFENLSRDSFKQFHLSSVQVSQGTSTPVSYKVAYENHDTPMDALAQLTYNQCYCYYNWCGPVRVPATLQYANKLSKMISECGKELVEELKKEDFKYKLFYL